MKEIKNCFICGNDKFSQFIKCKDLLLTKEEFQIVQCEKCGFLFTNPRPQESDIKKYYESDEYISHKSNKKTLFNTAYRLVRNLAIKKKFKLISELKQGNTLLDIGCGTGEFINFFKKNKWEVHGVEPNKDARALAVSNYGLNVKDEESLNYFENNFFDVITMWHVLEHVYPLNQRIEKVKQLLKDDGILIVAVPNCESWDAKFYKEFWAAYDVPRHLYHFSQKTIKLLFENNNLQILKTIPMKFDSYFVSLLSEKYSTGKINYLKAYLNGRKSNSFARKNHNNFSSLIYVLKKS